MVKGVDCADQHSKSRTSFPGPRVGLSAGIVCGAALYIFQGLVEIAARRDEVQLCARATPSATANSADNILRLAYTSRIAYRLEYWSLFTRLVICPHNRSCFSTNVSRLKKYAVSGKGIWPKAAILKS
ncbi:hypothetical protein GQ53DRAFT_122475 [Thozetella sp. PMI_491]|nr:hypothetical protein GQ53DRAFT_122475 [Thozetella sp. PMI_491]